MKIALILAAALLASTASASPSYTGNELLADMNEGPGGNLRAMRYIDGVVDGDVMGAIATGAAASSICMPQGSTLGQARDTVHAFLTATPSGRHRSAGAIVHTVLSANYPCVSAPSKQRQRGSRCEPQLPAHRQQAREVGQAWPHRSALRRGRLRTPRGVPGRHPVQLVPRRR